MAAPAIGRWFVAKTPASKPYPCMCGSGRRCGGKYCPCWGRTDHTDQMPNRCCMRRTEEHEGDQ
jgi:hypothetical protein